MQLLGGPTHQSHLIPWHPAGSAAVILGAAHYFPRFNKTLSVSSKTALIVTPAFGVFFLLSENKVNERKRQRAEAARQAAAAVRSRGY